MLSRRYAGSTRRGMVLGVAAMLTFASAGVAQQQSQADKTDKTRATKPVQKAQKEQKTSPELEKARAEVKALHEQMHKLREQMRATGEKLHKAHENLAKLEGRDTTHFAHHFGRHHHHGMHFAHWGGPHYWHARWMRGPWAHHWARFHDGEMIHHGGAAGGQDINARLDRLQHEIDALRSQLKTQGNPPRDR